MSFDIPVSILNLPKDVEAPYQITVHGECTGAQNEVIVIRQIGREVLPDAYVCHITDGTNGTGIYDMPKFKCIRVKGYHIQVRGEYHFTMACIAESETNMNIPSWERGMGLANWLY